MSSSSKVNASAAVGVSSVPTRVASDARLSATSRIEGVAGSESVGFSEYRQRVFDTRHDPGDFSGDSSGQDRGQPQFTPLVARAAAAFPATETYSESRSAATPFVSDVLRGLGIYQFNMKLFAGSFTSQGTILNRLS